jgi:drug/metabolite transporter (DMT)-like permease
MVGVAIVCALVGAVFLAFGTQRQGSAVRANTGGLSLNSRGFLRLLRSPRWLLGSVLLAAGMALNVYALASAPLTIVQPIGAIALVITTIVNSKDQGLRMNRTTIVAITACVLGSAVFVLLALNVTATTHQIRPEQELTVVLLLAVVVAVFLGLVMTMGHRLSAFVFIFGAGMLFGFVAVLVRLISVNLLDPNGLFLGNVSWYSVLAIVAAGVLGSWFVQSAYSNGPPDLVIAGLTVIDPLVGIGVGIAVLGELRPDVEPVMAIAMACAALLAIVGVVALSRHHPDVIQRRDEVRRRTKNAAAAKSKT